MQNICIQLPHVIWYVMCLFQCKMLCVIWCVIWCVMHHLQSATYDISYGTIWIPQFYDTKFKIVCKMKKLIVFLLIDGSFFLFCFYNKQYSVVSGYERQNFIGFSCAQEGQSKKGVHIGGHKCYAALEWLVFQHRLHVIYLGIMAFGVVGNLNHVTKKHLEISIWSRKIIICFVGE